MKTVSALAIRGFVETDKLHIDDFRLADGSVVPLTLAYTRTGPRDAPTYLILHGYAGSHHALDSNAGTSDAGWASMWAGPGKALDTNTQQVITVNLPGSAYGSSWCGADDSYASVHGMASAVDTLAEQLGVAKFAGVIGYSFGGYVAMQLKTDYPNRVGPVLGLCTSWQGRGHADELIALKALHTPSARRAFREQVLLRSGLLAYSLQFGTAATQREFARLDTWAQEFSAQALWRLRAAAIAFRLEHCPADTQLLYASSDMLFAPPASLPANVHVVSTTLGHQSLLYDPTIWCPLIDSWLSQPTISLNTRNPTTNLETSSCNVEPY